MRRAERLVLRLHRLCTRLLPSRLREFWGDEPHNSAREAVEAARRKRGAHAALATGVAECFDVALRGVSLRLRHGPGEWLEDAAADARLGLRSFVRRPGFSASVILTLGLGLGGTTAVFGALHGVYLAALPFDEPDRLVRLRSQGTSASGTSLLWNMPDRDVVAIREASRTLSSVVAMRGGSLVLLGDGQPQRVGATAVGEGWLQTLGVTPVLGRGFTPDEEALGRDAGVAILSHGLWTDRFGGDPDILGREVAHTSGAFVVVGVLPPGFRYPYDALLWTPLRLDPNNYRAHDLNVVGRLSEGVTLEQARSEMGRIYDRLEASDPATALDDGVDVTPVRLDYIRDDGRVVQALMAAVGFLFLLACLNVANLLAARFVDRDHELGIRAALGAGRSRQLRQLLTETVVLFLAGGAAGLLVVWALGDAFAALIPEVLTDQLAVGTSAFGVVPVAVGLALSLVAGLVFGGIGAMRASGADARGALRSGGRASTAGSRLHGTLVVGQLALSLVLLLAAGVMVDHFRALRGSDPGFRTADVHTFRISLADRRWQDPEVKWGLLRALEERLAAVPGIQGVGFTSVNPLCCGDWGADVEVEGRPNAPDAPPLRIHHRYVTPSYFEVMGIPIRQGSAFAPGDRPGQPGTVVVDESMARRFWPGEDPVGRRVRWDAPGQGWRTVVGVVGDIDEEGDYTEGWYLPVYQDPTGRSAEHLHVMVRSSDAGILGTVRSVVAEVEPTLAVYEPSSMEALRARLLRQDRLGSIVSIAFAAFGTLLAGLGLYGLLAYLVSSRTREIGTRMALGAPRAGIASMVLRRAGRLVGLGLAVGGVLSVASAPLLGRLLGRTEPPGVGVLCVLGAVLALVTVAAALAPALRAARIDPVEAVRTR